MAVGRGAAVGHIPEIMSHRRLQRGRSCGRHDPATQCTDLLRRRFRVSVPQQRPFRGSENDFVPLHPLKGYSRLTCTRLQIVSVTWLQLVSATRLQLVSVTGLAGDR